MKASELQPGQEFKIHGQRKFRKVGKVLHLDKHDHIPPVGRKVLILLDGDRCWQMTLLKDTEVLIR